MSPRVTISPRLLHWACDRARMDVEALTERFSKLPDWIAGEAKPTLKQVEQFAKATHTPVGFLFLAEPPVESVPIPDMRTMGNRWIGHPSPDLLDTIYVCEQRQDWYHDFARTERLPACPFVGSAKLTDDVVKTAASIRAALGFDLEARRGMSSWGDALRSFIEQADELGVLVMVTGIVGSNTHRKLDPEEFRGFALADELAPLVFINGRDTKAAQMFTLAHELAHLWLGESALTDVAPSTEPTSDTERWCNAVAAEVLVPLEAIGADYDERTALRDEVPRLARRFKVSTLVILRRIHDLGAITRERMWREYRAELERLKDAQRQSGGDFYRSQAARVSMRFARAVVVSTWEGRSSFTEAFRLLGVRRMASFRGLSDRLGIAV